jgi:hypothetical protein
VLTKDRHIRNNQVEIAALLASGSASFVLTAASLTGAAMATGFVQALREHAYVPEEVRCPFRCDGQRQRESRDAVHVLGSD